VLAGLATTAGILNLPFGNRTHFLERWLEPVVGESEHTVTAAASAQIGLAVLAVVGSLVGIAVAYRIYYQRKMEPVEPAIMAQGWKYDTSIAAFMGGPGREAFEATATFDGTVIDGAVNGVATLVRGSGVHLRKVQNGFVRTYALGVAVGVVALLAYFLSRVTF
jgi:NADH-quinone oxidoreductase subunit L